VLQISYRLTLACPVYVILSQYYDYEHIRTVHPHTLGEYRLVEVQDEGRQIVYDHHWPGPGNAVSRVRHTYHPPLTMEFEFIQGRYRGTRVRTLLAPQGEENTVVEETYFIPHLPNWRWLALLVKPSVMARVNAIWKEDLDVGVCMDGWPGVPACARAQVERQEMPVSPENPPVPLTPAAVPEGRGRCYRIRNRAAAVMNAGGRLYGLEYRCPHTGGPLALGHVTADGQCVECPWHGARFKLATGEHVSGPGHSGVGVIDLSQESPAAGV
jgi:nitrite reductase/ring-hydroxylating ferredoxin subunit